MYGRRPVVKDFRGVVDREWFSGKSEDLSSKTVDDTIWAILRIDPSRLLKTTFLERELLVSLYLVEVHLMPYCIQTSSVPPTSATVHYLMLLQRSSTQSILS